MKTFVLDFQYVDGCCKIQLGIKQDENKTRTQHSNQKTAPEQILTLSKQLFRP